MRYKLILTVLLFPTLLLAQQNEEGEPCYPCRSPEEIFDFESMSTCCDETYDNPDLFPRIIKRERNNNFYHSMLYAHPPSVVSGARFTSFTHNTLGYTKKSFVLDADVNFPIAIGGPRFGLNTIHIIPRFKVRIFADDPNVPALKGDTSLPVRTPSTIPGVAYYWSCNKLWNPNSVWSKLGKENDPDDPNLKDNQYFGVYAFHHSDGQDGDEIYAGDSSVNIYNGNYGEQVVFEFIYGHERLIHTSNDTIYELMSKRKKDVLNFRKAKNELFLRMDQYYLLNWRVSYEIHPYGLSNEVFRDLSQWGDYPEKSTMLGRHRINARATFSIIPTLVEFLGLKDEKQWCQVTPEARYERWRFIADLSYIIDPEYYRGQYIPSLEKVPIYGINRRLNLSFSAYHVLKRSRHAAVFAEVAYYGSDRYNIYFNQSLFQFRYGLAFGFFDQYESPELRF